MKTIFHRCKRKIVLFSIILLCVIGIIVCEIIPGSYMSNVLVEIKSDPIVLDAEEFGIETGLLYRYYTIGITFNNGGSIYATRVNMFGKESKNKSMAITLINNNVCVFYNKNEKETVINKDLAIWSAIIGVHLETIVDVAKNFYVINEHIERWTDLSDYKQDNEIFIETLTRVISNNLYSDTVSFDEQEYVLLKYPRTTKWAVVHARS